MSEPVTDMESAQSKESTTPGQPAEALAEICRRVVRIHLSLASATDDDCDVRRWSVRQLMDLIHDLESLDRSVEAANDGNGVVSPSAP